MVYGYARVSSKEQNLERQLELLHNKYHVDKIFDEKVSGKNTKDREVFTRLMNTLCDGDTLIVAELSRLGRSLKDLISIIDELNKKNVKLIIDKENFDTSTASGRMMFQISAAFAQYEREIMLERQYEGIQIAKAEGKYKGRPFVKRDPLNINMVCTAYINRKIKIKDAAAMIQNVDVRDKATGALVTTVGVTIPTFYKILDRWMKDNNIRKVNYVTSVESDDDEVF